MKRLIIICATFAVVEVAVAQYVPTPNFGVPVVPDFVPSAPPTGYALPGYTWRDLRGADDWRNNTFREDRFDEDWRNRGWRTRRELQDWQQRGDYAKSRIPDNPFERGYVECGEGAAGLSFPCNGYAKDRSAGKTGTLDGYGNAPDNQYQMSSGRRQNAVARGVENCGHLSVWRRCQ